MAKLRSPRRHRTTIARIVHARRKLFLSALFGIAVLVAAPASWPVTSRVLFGWDCGVAVYLAAVYWLMARADIPHIQRRATVEDEGALTMLILTVAAAVATLGAIVVELSSAKAGGHPGLSILLAFVTILLSWAFIHTIFALHYAHEFYGEGRDAQKGGMQFPGGADPDYWDFVYFSFVIGMTFQVSDVAVTSKGIRRLVVSHGIVSFMYDTTLIALMVNTASSVI